MHHDECVRLTRVEIGGCDVYVFVIVWQWWSRVGRLGRHLDAEPDPPMVMRRIELQTTPFFIQFERCGSHATEIRKDEFKAVV